MRRPPNLANSLANHCDIFAECCQPLAVVDQHIGFMLAEFGGRCSKMTSAFLGGVVSEQFRSKFRATVSTPVRRGVTLECFVDAYAVFPQEYVLSTQGFRDSSVGISKTWRSNAGVVLVSSCCRGVA